MRQHLQGIDHVVIAVTDLDQAQTDFQRLGFTLTPRGRHTMGSQNHCAMFPTDYFELLAVPADHPVTRYYSDFLRQGDGLAALALKTDDAKAFHAELLRDGIGCDAPVDFSRPVNLAEGVRDAAFRIAQVNIAETPGGRTFACQHFTRDVVWQPDDLIHANGAVGLQGISLLTDQARFEEVRVAYERLFDRSAQGSGEVDVAWKVATGDTPITLLTPSSFDNNYAGCKPAGRSLPFVAALHFHVKSIKQTQQFLKQVEVACTVRSDQSLAVCSGLTHGLVIVFTEFPA